MQRKPSKKTRGANAAEKRHMAWAKEQPCIVCMHPGPSIAHHCWGATEKKKVNLVTVLIGHWAVMPLCERCDSVVTNRSRRGFENLYGRQIDHLLRHLDGYPGKDEIPEDVMDAFDETYASVY